MEKVGEDYGLHCSEPTCRQLDFLPIKCNHCGLPFCAEHYDPTRHSCSYSLQPPSDRTVPRCPLCNQPVYVGLNEDPNIAVNRHIEQGCKLPARPSNLIQCTFHGCSEQMHVPLFCPYCHKALCVKHHLPESHMCTQFVPEGQAKHHSLQGRSVALRAQLANRPKSTFAEQRAKRMKAKGDSKVKHLDKVYIDIHLPDGTISTHFVNKNLFIGRIIDDIAKIEHLVNHNNVPGEKKLGLFLIDSDTPLSMSSRVHEFFSNGSELYEAIMDYF
ncbi:putative AN1-type zinc finger protein 2A [Blattamonas nauphoetae]|uniref:AN1-type zinc finger protein 2A n=1 Tax=Blattamonas nauphoetae TaxID=2049346 RepID=A0ABQ9WRU1_9EUKA|nr:putative AN1-type zinc finger protein 2A [Blattamonas nauphoetae]